MKPGKASPKRMCSTMSGECTASDNSDEHEADVGFQEKNEEVTPPSRDMLLAIQTLRKGLFFRNADQWLLFCKLDDAVEQAT